MKASNYRVVPLNSEVAEAARRGAKAGAPDHVYVTADSPTGYPCRHCLHWAQPGEQLVLFPFASIAPVRPYSETGPIFVHAQPCPVYEANGQYPPAFREGRVIRAYNAQQDMIDAEVAGDRDPETIIEKLLANPETKFLQARSADRGCYTFAIERA
ncbi:DUF1203 domain-containing protein [soil metagenome]